jgi:hypothetical protein
MTYPPSVPPNTRTNATPLPTNLPSDINTISNALTDIINELGSDPSGAAASLTARLDLIDGAVEVATTGPGGVRRCYATKVGDFVIFSGYCSGDAVGASFPAGYRPVTGSVYSWALLNNGGTVTPGYATITTGGVITASAAASSWVFLNGMFQWQT